MTLLISALYKRCALDMPRTCWSTRLECARLRARAGVVVGRARGAGGDDVDVALADRVLDRYGDFADAAAGDEGAGKRDTHSVILLAEDGSDGEQAPNDVPERARHRRAHRPIQTE